MSPEVQHDALHVLRRQQRLQLRLPHGQVLLAEHHRPTAHDAGGRAGIIAVHQPLRRLRSDCQRDCRAQPVPGSAGVPRRLEGSVDRLQLRHGNFLHVPNTFMRIFECLPWKNFLFSLKIVFFVFFSTPVLALRAADNSWPARALASKTSAPRLSLSVTEGVALATFMVNNPLNLL